MTARMRSPETIEAEMLRLRLRLREPRAERRLALLRRERQDAERKEKEGCDGE